MRPRDQHVEPPASSATSARRTTARPRRASPAFTPIAAQELGRYGVTVICLAPNARTRMTEAAFGEIPRARRRASTRWIPRTCRRSSSRSARTKRSTSPASASSSTAAPSTCSPAVGRRRAVSPRDDALGPRTSSSPQLLERLPDGAAPEGMVAMMAKAGGRSARLPVRPAPDLVSTEPQSRAPRRGDPRPQRRLRRPVVRSNAARSGDLFDGPTRRVGAHRARCQARRPRRRLRDELARRPRRLQRDLRARARS